ncbi:MAG: MBL fold metallo-hydrolase [Firmicutes bacterium]|nr:MBL fold metallo-hydrolase [Bacillota bacterium]
MTAKRAKKIITWIVVGGMLGIFLFDGLSVLLSGAWEKRWPVLRADPAGEETAGRIHFLNTDNSDCILLESGGHFALVDSGWGSDNPNKKSRRPGCEQRVLDYLKRVCAGPDGSVTLDFVLPTHFHYDHAGGFPRILADPAVRVGTVYLRPLTTGNQKEYELEDWGIGEIHRRIGEAAAARGLRVETVLPDKPFALGNMTLRLLNLDSYENPKLRGENDNSVVVLVECAGVRTLLCGDITATHGLEKEIGRAAGPVDVMKLPHHGYAMSSSIPLLRNTRPKLAVVTNGIGQVYPNVRWNLAFYARTSLYSSVRENGVSVSFSPEGKIWVTGNLHVL